MLRYNFCENIKHSHRGWNGSKWSELALIWRHLNIKIKCFHQGWFHQTLCAKQKVAGARLLAKKCHSISPKIRQYPHLQAEFCAPFAKSVRQSPSAICHYMLLILYPQKKPCIYHDEIDTWCQFHQLSTYIFYARRSQKDTDDLTELLCFGELRA